MKVRFFMSHDDLVLEIDLEKRIPYEENTPEPEKGNGLITFSFGAQDEDSSIVLEPLGILLQKLFDEKLVR